MISINHIRVRCPFCGAEVKAEAFPFTEPKAVWCDDMDGGGCQKIFVYRTEVDIKAFTYKVEGQGE